MRVLIDSMIALMLVAVVVVVLVMHTSSREERRDVETVRSALERLNEQAAYHTAVQSAMAGQDTLLVHLQQGWFGENLPTNVLVGEDHPWIDLAPPGDLGTHPPDPVATETNQAGFWYNPTTGTFRARVAPRSSEAQTLALYNEINGTALDSFEQMPDPARRPIAHTTGGTPAHQYASLANQTWAPSEPADSEPEDTQPLYVSPADEYERNPFANVVKLGDTDGASHFDDQAADITPEPEPADEAESSSASVRPTLE